MDLVALGATQCHIEQFVHSLLNENIDAFLKEPMRDLVLRLLGFHSRNPDTGRLMAYKTMPVLTCRKAHIQPLAATLSSPHIFQTFAKYSRKNLYSAGGAITADKSGSQMGLYKSQTIDSSTNQTKEGGKYLKHENIPKLSENSKQVGKVLGRYMDGTWSALAAGFPKGLSTPKVPLEEAAVIQKNKLVLEHVMVWRFLFPE